MGKNITTRRILVGTTVVDLVGENPKRKGLLVYNKGTVAVYILGAKNLSKEDGMPLEAKAYYEDNESTGALYIVAESGTQDVRVLTIGE